MFKLNQLRNTTKYRKTRKRVGRGTGSGVGKTCGRGEKGAGARAGYTRRLGYEGGQFRTFMKLPIRGFSNFNFRRTYETINLGQIEALFNDGETVCYDSLKKRGFLSGQQREIKVLGDGTLTKKVKLEVHAISANARDKLQKAKIPVTVLSDSENA